jgi:GNAT superfamily N-acetyltransferase
MSRSFRTDFVTPGDRDQWRPLFDGYAAFYDVDMTDAIANTTFGWLLDPEHALEGLITRDTDNRAVGIAHVRACPRPLGGCEIGFLDDMFVSPDARGSGAADAIFDALQELAVDRGWPAIRWITQHFNERGRGFYDRYTNGPTDFIVYQRSTVA